jgi:YgiT-type zinc finger domain-containing protein
MKTCYFCKGEVVERRIQHVHQWGEKIIIFEDVPAEVCQQCGETYFSPEVLDKMDEVTMGEEKPKATISVPIFSLAEAVTA